jgi:release factor glutamine methyltransferase
VKSSVESILASAGLENAHREARWLIEAAAGDVGRASQLAQRRAAGEPLQYLTGVAGFRSLELAVGPGVLIPRPETEIVAGRAFALLPDGGTIVDIGTGSGAIALSAASERPDARVIATELSEEALAWAKKNKASLGLDVELLHGDLFDPLPEALGGKVDVVVSNPPYVAERERGRLPRDVGEHEPQLALFARDGLEVIRRLIIEAPSWLCPDGWLVLEIGETQAADVAALLRKSRYRDAFIEQDLTGRERIAAARRP